MLESERLSFGHARALLGIGDAVLQRRFAQKIVKYNWSVRETERRIKHLSQDRRVIPRQGLHQNDPNIRAAEVKLRRHLGTQVRLLPPRSGSSGKIEIEYYSAVDLDRIYNIILPSREHQANSTAATTGW